MSTILNIDFSKLSNRELLEIRNKIDLLISNRYSSDIDAAKDIIEIGSRCKVNNPRTEGKVFVVDKINKKNAICYEEDEPSKKWNIGLTALRLL